MSNFDRVRAPLFWTVGSVWLTSEAEEVDSRWPKVPNFTDGSTHAPTVQVVVGGQGLEVSGDFIADEASLIHVSNNGTLDLGVDAVIDTGTTGVILLSSGGSISMAASSFITVGNNADINVSNGGDINLASGAELHVNSGGVIDVHSGGIAAIESGGALNVNSGGTVFASGGSVVDIANLATLQLDSGSVFTVKTVAVLSGNTAGVANRIGTLPDSNSNVDVTKDEWLVLQSLPTANRTYTLDKTTHVPTAGQRLRVSRFQPSGNAAIFKREDGTQLAQLQQSGDQGGWVEFIYYSGDWRVSAWGDYLVGGLTSTVITMPAATY